MYLNVCLALTIAYLVISMQQPSQPNALTANIHTLHKLTVHACSVVRQPKQEDVWFAHQQEDVTNAMIISQRIVRVFAQLKITFQVNHLGL
jgi:hypothetical protein